LWWGDVKDFTEDPEARPVTGVASRIEEGTGDAQPEDKKRVRIEDFVLGTACVGQVGDD